MEWLSRWPARSLAVIAVLAVAAVLGLAMGTAPPASAAALGCSWGTHYGLGAGTNGDPDANAAYWAKSYLALPGGGLTIQGTFPTARYMNFTIYRNTKAIAGAHLHDAQIQPSTGVNPFQPGVQGTGTYELHVVNQAAPADPAPNTLYTGASPLSLLEIVYRVYDPADFSNPAGSPALPQITPTLFGYSLAPLGTCTGAGVPALSRRPAVSPHAAPRSAVSPHATPSPAEPVWSKSAVTSLYPDPDSAYLSTLLDARDGPLVVIQASLPIFPDTNTGDASWDAAQQVRYWSLCENTLTVNLVGCVGDFQAVQNAGTGTFVVSTPANQPANATPANGINWIPFGSGASGLLLYRQILASPSFSESIAAAPVGSLASTMGSYLPQIAYCSEAEWAAAGAAGCLATAPASGG
jgi:hypothetical protein